MNNRNRGGVMIESVVVIPLVFLLILGLFEVNRIRSTQRILDSLSINVATEIAAYPIDKDRINSIIKRHLNSSHMNIIIGFQSTDDLKYYIDFYTNNYIDNYSTPKYENDRPNGDIQKDDGKDVLDNEENNSNSEKNDNTNEYNIERGNDIVVTFCYKFKFLCALTCAAFTGSTNKPLYLYSRSRTKRL